MAIAGVRWRNVLIYLVEVVVLANIHRIVILRSFLCFLITATEAKIRFRIVAINNGSDATTTMTFSLTLFWLLWVCYSNRPLDKLKILAWISKKTIGIIVNNSYNFIIKMQEVRYLN